MLKLKQLFISLFIVLCLFSYSPAWAQNIKKVNTTSGQVSLKSLIQEIEKQTDYTFVFDNSVTISQNVSLKGGKEEINALLKQVLNGQGIVYEIVGKQIILKKDTALTNVQKQVTGTVKDELGETVIGASVKIKGTSTGTITDIDGNFSLTVPTNAELEVSFVGFTTQNMKVASKQNFQITLKENTKILQEVVVTALGIKREERALGYSVQKVSGNSLQKVRGVDVGSSLTGKVAGLLVKNSPDFASEPDLSIRGEKPLLVIDGVAYANKSLNDIAAEDIESMSVLKGATASALYGFRGSSGAILITTKNGSSNDEGITVDLSTNTMFAAGYLAIPERQSVYGRGGENIYDINSTKSWGVPMDGRIMTQWDPVSKELRDYEYLPVGKDNFKNFLNSGFITNNNVNISYKTQKASLRSSLNWTENNGQYPNQKLDKISYTFGGDITLDKLKLSSNLSYTKRTSPNVGGSGFTSYEPMNVLLLNTSADFNILDYKNNYWSEKGKKQNWTYNNGVESNNPYFDAYERTNSLNRDIFNADVTLSYDISKWLKATVRSGLDFYISRGELRVSQGSNLASGSTSIPGYANDTWNGKVTGAYMVGQEQGISMNTDFLLSGNKEFGKFNFEYLFGSTIFYQDNKTMKGSTNGGITIPGYFSLSASVNPAKVAEVRRGQQVNSAYGRVALSWNRLAFAEVTGRNDWSSTLPEETRSYFYPSFSGSFVASELLPQTKEWMDLLKVRGSWTMSKTPPSIYAINQDFEIYADTWNGLTGAGYPRNLYPSGALPESSSTYEIGLQGIFFGNRLSADVTYYSKRMYDFLKEAPVSPTTGYWGKFVNIDEEITRRGWEVSLGGTPIKTRDWQWNVNFNWSKFARYYTKLDDTYSLKKPWVKEGERVDAFVSRDFVRDPQGNLVFNNGRLQVSQYTSNFGWTDPDWLWGLNSTLRYKNFSLFVSMDGVVGGVTGSRTESYMWQNGLHPGSITDERAKDVANPGSKNFIGKGVKVVSGSATYDLYGNITSDNRVFAPNDEATTYKQYIQDLHNSSAFDWDGYHTSADTYSKTFFKIRELSLTYDVPTEFAKKMKMKAASISFVAQNLMLWSKDFTYSDPDGGKEDLSDPSSRYLGANIKITF